MNDCTTDARDGANADAGVVVPAAARYRASAATPHKQDGLRDILVYNTSAVGAIRRKFNIASDYLWVDMNAGPGVNPDTGAAGSPVIARGVLLGQNIPHTAHLYELDPDAYTSCALHVAGWTRATLHNADHRLACDLAHRLSSPSRWGMVYHDPSNARLSVDVLQSFAKWLPKVDILVNLACASYKRSVNHDDYMPLADVLDSIGKRFWIVREPFGKHQWSMVIGTNWEGWSRTYHGGFHRHDTDTGREILDALSRTRDERRACAQPELIPDAYATYEEYLRHPKFRAVRAEAMRAAGWKCQRCHEARATQVHHLRYPAWGTFDVMENLLPVCYACHCEIHGKSA